MQIEEFQNCYKYSKEKFGRCPVTEQKGIVTAIQSKSPFMLRTCYYFHHEDGQWMYACHFGYEGKAIEADKWSAVEIHVVSELPEYDETSYYMINDDVVLCDREERDIHLFVSE